MRIVCAPEGYDFEASAPDILNIVLYGHTDRPDMGSIGATVRNNIRHCKIQPSSRAWDLLSIALSVIAADTAVPRDSSPDGWTRQLDLHVAVSDPVFWSAQRGLLEKQLRFLTTDIWNVTFLEGGIEFVSHLLPVRPIQDCVVLLSGGLDSLIGTIDLVNAYGKNPYAVSQISQGDKKTQSFFASKIGDGLAHLQLNHSVKCPGVRERSQRARSIIFLAYGVLVATALARYHEGEDVTLYICENGFISINPPLTGARLGSLSTRTTHPVFLGLFQKFLDTVGLRVKLETPYQFLTKGEMLKDCADQAFLREYAHISTSCGRYARNGYKHCGRCVPCLIRRAAFYASGITDRTSYVYSALSRDDKNHARFDDVRSAAMAVAAAKINGFPEWARRALSATQLDDVTPFRDVVHRGLEELDAFLSTMGVT